MPRVDAELGPGHRKNASHEEFLQRFNEALAQVQLDVLDAPDTPPLPIVFIIGPPRSGTTLVSQLMVMRQGYGYVSNFVARFYKAPAIGMMLEEIYRGYLDTTGGQALESRFGQTQGLLQPHEFGYFWDRWFDHGQRSHKLDPRQLAEVPVGEMRREIAAMQTVCRMPMVFKHAPYCSLQVSWLIKAFPKAVFVSCAREPLYNCQSIALAREAMLGSRQKWLSTVPPQIDELLDLPWHEQVARQVHWIRAEIERTRISVPSGQWVDCRYEELCDAPRAVVAQIDAAVAEVGATLPSPSTLPDVLGRRDQQRLPHEEFEMLRAVTVDVDPWRKT